MENLDVKFLYKVLMLGHMAGQIAGHNSSGPTADENLAREYALNTIQKLKDFYPKEEESDRAKDSANKARIAEEIRTECYDCKHKHDVPGNAHVTCINPDFEMTGDKHGIANGWFHYPLLFDPCWKTKKCTNFEKR